VPLASSTPTYATAFPEIIEAGIARDWAWVAHGQTNSIVLSGMTLEQEQQHLSEMLVTLDGSLPARREAG